MWAMLEERLRMRLKTDSRLFARLPAIEASVADGKLSPAMAADEIARQLNL
jgi:LAO/AO transport system kinase